MSDKHNSPLESMYDDPAFKEARHLEPYKKAKRWAWNIAGMLALAMLMIVFVFGMVGGSGLLVGLLLFGLVLFVCLLTAACISAILAFFPLKHINYVDRIYIWLPMVMVVNELLLVGALFFFSSHPVW